MRSPKGEAWWTHRGSDLGFLVAAAASARGRPPFSEIGRVFFVYFPIEEIIVAGPRVDFAPANFTAETAGMPGRMLLLCRGVRQRAIRTAKIFDCKKTACHGAMMLRAERLFQLDKFP